jgi:transcriptional regulator with XRE-family HTH domain
MPPTCGAFEIFCSTMGLEELAAAELTALLIGLKHTRQRRGDMSQRRLAEILEVAVTSVQDWELLRDTPTLPHMILWAHELGYRLEIRDDQLPARPETRLKEGDSREVREYARMALALRAARRHRGIRQDQLAERLKVSRWSVIRWERAQVFPRPITFLRWAIGVGCRVQLADL